MTSSVFPVLTPDALAAMELLGTPVYVYDFASEHIAWSNSSALQFWNAESAEELVSRELTPYSESTRLRLADYQACFREGKSVTESWTFYPRGIATPTISRCRGVRLEGGGEAMMVEIQALSEASLPVTELRAIEALRHTSLMVSMFSETGEVLMRNPTAQAFFGEFDKAHKPGANLFHAMFADPNDAQLLLSDTMETGREAVRTAPIAVNGLPIHALQMILLTDPVNAQKALLVTQQDVTMLARVSRQLAASEAALNSVLSLSVGPALVASLQDGGILKANFAAQSVLGSLPTTHVLASDSFANPADYDAFRSVIIERGEGTVQVKLKAANGSVFWAVVSGAQITYDKQDALVFLVTDINQLYQMTAELEAALDIERQTAEMQRRFLAIAAHDLRTPLAIIDNTAQMLERSAATSAPDQTQARASRIRSTVQRMLKLLENTIESTRRSLGVIGYEPKNGSIVKTISDVALSFKETHPELELSLDLPSIPELGFDRYLLEQALTNLLSNAIKYSEGKPQVEITAKAEPSHVEILVRDHGIGIPEQDRGTVFDDYARAGNVGERPGTGLGLSIVRQIANLHGGNVDLVETTGQGTTVRMTLPLQ